MAEVFSDERESGGIVGGGKLLNMTIPKEHRKITAPYYSIGIHEYWGDIYESIFCYLKPFLKVKDDSEIFNSIEDLNIYFDYKLLAENTTPLSWNYMLKLTGLKTLGQLRIAMFGSSLKDICKKEKIILPYQDDFSPHQLENIIPILSRLGHDKITCIPELPEYESSIVVDLEVDALINLNNKRRCLQTLDQTLFFGNAFDFVETYICGPRKEVHLFAESLEGFMVAEKVRTNWHDDYDLIVN